MESLVVFGFGFAGGCLASGWLAFVHWGRPKAQVEKGVERVPVSPKEEEPEETQRLDTKELSALLAHRHPHTSNESMASPKRVITPNRKVPAMRSSAGVSTEGGRITKRSCSLM